MEEPKISDKKEKLLFASRPGVAFYIIGIAMFFTAFEFLKSKAFPHLSIWQSHLMSILMVILLSTVFFLYFRGIIIKENRAKEKIHMDLLREDLEHKQMMKALKESEYLLREAQRLAHIGSFTMDYETRIWKGTPETNDILGIDETYPHTVERLVDIIHPEWRDLFISRLASLRTEKKNVEFEYKIIRRPTGEERWIQGFGGFIYDESTNTQSVIGTILDITERKEKETETRYLSYHDQLTGLYNRRFYEEELKRMDTVKNLPMTIVMGDVNGLKLINDSFGHDVGDELLLKGADAIRECCRAEDILARIGGDEFVMIMPRIDADEAEQIIKKIKLCAAEKYVENIPVSISFGYETKRESTELIQDVVKKAEDYMYKKKLFENESLRGKTIRAIVAALYEKNSREEKHSIRVSELCETMGTALGFPEYQIMELKTVGLFHDIGKIGITEELLNKKEELTDEERTEMRRHPEIGYRILSTSNEMADLAGYVLAHHERWDGKGYPRGLKGTEIPLVSRIVAIIDAYDAITSDDTYRPPRSDQEAVAELRQDAGTMFDPYLVGIFIERVIGINENAS